MFLVRSWGLIDDRWEVLGEFVIVFDLFVEGRDKVF